MLHRNHGPARAVIQTLTLAVVLTLLTTAAGCQDQEQRAGGPEPNSQRSTPGAAETPTNTPEPANPAPTVPETGNPETTGGGTERTEPQPTERGKATAMPATLTPEPTAHLAEEPSDQPGRPAGPELTLLAIQDLTPEERECLPQQVREGWVDLRVESANSTNHAQILKEVADCVSDESIVRLMVLPGLEENNPLEEQERDCLTGSNSGATLRIALESEGEYPTFTEAAVIAFAGTLLNVRDCLTEERLSFMGIEPQDLEVLTCLVQDTQEAQAITRAIVDGNETGVPDMDLRLLECSAQLFPENPEPEPLPICGQDGTEPGAPCREE